MSAGISKVAAYLRNFGNIYEMISLLIMLVRSSLGADEFEGLI